jgi:Na+/H+ antiporter NhaD/arsenite permease-like protein
MNIYTIILVILAVCGVVWAYPRLPSPWNYVLVAVIAIACVFILLNAGGVPINL